MNFQKAESEGWFIKVNNDNTRTASFTNKGEIGRSLFQEMGEWVDSGNSVGDYVAPTKTQEQIQEEGNQKNQGFLNATDSQVLKYLRKIKLGTITTGQQQAFDDLELERDAASQSII